MSEIQQDVKSVLTKSLSLRRWKVYLKKRIRQGFRRAYGSTPPITETAIASTLAYWLAGLIFTHTTIPFFAAIACWICMGFTRDRAPRRVLEMGSGVAIGILFGDLFGIYFGVGVWQVLVILIIAPIVARFLDRGDLFTIQAAINSLVILMFSAMQFGGIFDRLGDAFVGAAVAFVFTVLLPRDVSSRPTRYLRSAFGELKEVLDGLSRAIGWGDQIRLTELQMELRSLRQTWTGGYTTVRNADEVTYLNPSLKKERTRVLKLKREYILLERIQNILSTILRQSTNVVAELGALPQAGEALTIAAAAVHEMRKSLDDFEAKTKGRALAIEFAAHCQPDPLTNPTTGSDSWRSTALFALYRNLAVDILQLSGMTWKEATEHIPGAQDVNFMLDFDPELGDEADRMWTGSQN